MNLLPDWMPLWLQLALLAGGAIFGLIYLLLPFAIFGVKPRLEEVELQLGELRAELRTLNMRLARDEAGAAPRAQPEPPPQPGPVAAPVRPESPRPTPQPLRQEERPATPSVRDDYLYEDRPVPDPISQILRPTHFEPPPAREAPRPPPPPPSPWDAPPAETWPPPRPEPERPREEMSPRPTPEEERRRQDAEPNAGRRPRSEPTLRWPPKV